MPLVDVTYASSVTADHLRRLASHLPDLVAAAVDCPEEPWTGPAGVGDIEIRFRPKGEFDIGTLAMVIELRTKSLPSRRNDSQRRADALCAKVTALDVAGAGDIGVWLILHDGAWSQT